MKIFLIGFMASGKTTLGKWVAAKAGMRFVDLDQWIERKEGRGIPEIFAAEGEEAFRQLEAEALADVIALDEDLLVSCGGGTPCFFDNMERMNAAGMTVYLKLSPQTLAERLRKAKTDRPLLVDTGVLEHWIAQKLESRSPFYEKAQYIRAGKETFKKEFWEFLQPQLQRLHGE